MTYLVTGATGFVGRALVVALLEQGHTVKYLAPQKSERLSPAASFLLWPRDGIPRLEPSLEFDAVFHLAGEPVAQRWSKDAKRRIHDSRVKGTRKLVTALADLRTRPPVLVSASAVGYYGDRGDELLGEDQRPGTDLLAQICQQWEAEALRARESGIRVVPVRIGTVLGRNGGALERMLPPFRLGLGGKFGSGRQWLSWIHLSDLVRLLMFASVQLQVNGTLNGSSPNPVTNAEFTAALAQALHKPAVFTVPEFALKLALGEMAHILFSSQRVIPQAPQNAGFRFEFPTIERALENLV